MILISFYKSLPEKEKQVMRETVFAHLLQKNIFTSVKHNPNSVVFNCPRCNKMFWGKEYITKYCSNCGQALKL